MRFEDYILITLEKNRNLTYILRDVEEQRSVIIHFEIFP